MLISSLSHSPLFAMNTNYKIDKSSFIKHFSTIFYAHTSLYCSNSNFKYLLSSLINSENVDENICPTNGNPHSPSGNSLSFYRDIANQCAVTFSTFISVSGGNIDSVSISECLFYKMDLTTQTGGNYFIYLKDTITNCQFVGNCFSEITVNSYLINCDQTISSNPFVFDANSFHANAIKAPSYDSALIANRLVQNNLNIHNNNFSLNSLSQCFAISVIRSMTTPCINNIQYCDVYSNSLAGVMADGVRNADNINTAGGSTQIQYMQCVGNTIFQGSFQNDLNFANTHAVFYIN